MYIKCSGYLQNADSADADAHSVDATDSTDSADSADFDFNPHLDHQGYFQNADYYYCYY